VDNIYSLVGFLIGNYFVAFLILGLAAALMALAGKPRTGSNVAESFLSYYMLFPIGMSYVVNFVFHVFFGDLAARFIGWANSPFQTELGFVSLGIGVAGIMAFIPLRHADSTCDLLVGRCRRPHISDDNRA